MSEMIQMGMTTVITDTSRMKREIVPALIYPTLKERLMALLSRGRARRCTYRHCSASGF